MSSKATMKLQSALISTGLVQPVSEESKGGYLEVLCRQIPGQEKAWLRVVESLLVYSERSDSFKFHICRRYVMKNGQMVFGWHISIDCKNTKTLDRTVDVMVAEVLEEVRASLAEPAAEPPPQHPQAQPQAVRAAPRQPLAPGQHPPTRVPPPRPPNDPGTVVGTPPANFAPAVRVVQNTRDERGKVTIVEEMALPHVYSELNVPNSKGKGAKFTGGG